MRIGLVFPQSTFLEQPMMFPPLGLWYLAAQLEAQGHTTDFFALDVHELPPDGEFDQLWVSYTSPQIHAAREIAKVTKDWTKTRTVAGGAGPWANPATAQELGYDVVVAGEADHPAIVKLILDQAAHGRGLLRPPITPGPLDWVLPPVRRWDRYYDATLTDHHGLAHRTTTLFTSRGCPMACAFCESGRNGVIWDRLVRYEPISTVDAQLQQALRNDHTGIMFYDDILPLNKPRMLEILELMRKYKFIWRCFIRTDVIEKQGGYEYLAQMAEAGLVEVLAGVESADNRIKANIHKGTTIEQDTQALEWCKKLGIKFKASLILGLPGEDRESMNKTREWIFANRPARVDVNTLIPFPGTPITKDKDADGNEYDVYWTEQLSEEYFYKGHRNTSNGLVGTSALKPNEIKAFRDQLVADMIAAGIPS